MDQNVKLLYKDMDTKFNKDYYRNKYVEAVNKIATMTGKIVDIQERLINRQNEVSHLKADNEALRNTVKRLKGLKIKKSWNI